MCTHDLVGKSFIVSGFLHLSDRLVVTIEIPNNTRFCKLVFYDFSKESTFVIRAQKTHSKSSNNMEENL